VHLGRVTVLPAEFRNEHVQECTTIEQRYFGLRNHGFSAWHFSEQ
jgi:hypothetical protein